VNFPCFGLKYIVTVKFDQFAVLHLA